MFRQVILMTWRKKSTKKNYLEKYIDGGVGRRPQARWAFLATDEEGVPPRPDTTAVPHLLDTSTHPFPVLPCRSSSPSVRDVSAPTHTLVRKYATKQESQFTPSQTHAGRSGLKPHPQSEDWLYHTRINTCFLSFLSSYHPFIFSLHLYYKLHPHRLYSDFCL